MSELDVVDSSIAEFEADAADLVYQWEAGRISKSQWREKTLALIVTLYILMWLFGNRKGSPSLSPDEQDKVITLIAKGEANLTPGEKKQLAELLNKVEVSGESLPPEERTKVEAMVTAQMKYFDPFTENLAIGLAGATVTAEGVLSASEIIRRVKMYLNSSRQAYEQARVYGFADLPAYPGDGSSECLSNCHCHWEIQVSERNLVAYWRLGAADHCKTCRDRADTWSPYIVRLDE